MESIQPLLANELTKQYYFHPLMKGWISIKKVLPAILSSVNSSRIITWLKDFEKGLSLYALDDNKLIKDPYKLLPPIKLKTDEDVVEQVNEGTDAMRIYQDMMIGLNKNDIHKINEYEKALKRYCKLDTLAMVIIWEYRMNYKEN